MSAQTVGVIFGGRSSEHEISLRSAVYVLKNIPSPWKVLPIGITRQGHWCVVGEAKTVKEWKTHLKGFSEVAASDLAEILNVAENTNNFKSSQHTLLQKGIFAGEKIKYVNLLPTKKDTLLAEQIALNDHSHIKNTNVLNFLCDIAFPVVHGPNCEDGRIQGLLELAEIPFVGCDSVVSGLGMDKNFQKIIARNAGIPVAKYEMVTIEEWKRDEGFQFENVLKKIQASIGLPCFVKPNALGSAVGVNRCTSTEELKKNLAYALAFDERALIEEPMVGTEVECSFLGTTEDMIISTPGEIAAADFYSYEAKYENETGAKTFLPARLDASKTLELQQSAKKVAKALCLEGLCRIDFWNCHKTGRFVFNEVNTLPGMTSISMFPQLLAHDGITSPQWIKKVLLLAVERNTRLAQRSVNKK